MTGLGNYLLDNGWKVIEGSPHNPNTYNNCSCVYKKRNDLIVIGLIKLNETILAVLYPVCDFLPTGNFKKYVDEIQFGSKVYLDNNMGCANITPKMREAISNTDLNKRIREYYKLKELS